MVKLVRGINDLETLFPELAKQWHPALNGELKPCDVTKGSSKKIWWICNNEHIWESRINHRTDGIGCPYCSGRYPIEGKTDLLTTNPELAKEWYYEGNKSLVDGQRRDISTPDKITAHSNQKVWWICEHGHTWEASPNHRSSGNGCPICSGQQVLKHVNDLETINPKLAAEWHPVKNTGRKDKNGRDISTPDKVTAKSNQKITWLCPVCDYEWIATVRSRANGTGCPCCANKVVVAGVNDLETTHPFIARQWHSTLNGNLKPSDITYGSKLKILWECDRGHIWKASVDKRTAGSGCPICSGHQLKVNYNDLATTHPNIASEWHPTLNDDLNPTEVMAGSHRSVYWLCAEGHEWESSVLNRTRPNGTGCPYCAGSKVIVGKTDLQTVNPEIASEWHPTLNDNLNPTDVGRGCHKKVWWLCKNCNNEWVMVVYNRTCRAGGCPVCNRSLGEKAIRKVLEDNNIIFETEYKFKDRYGPSGKQLLKDDFAILNKNGNVVGTIEYHGEQHYFPVDFSGRGAQWAKDEFEKNQLRDSLKTKYLQDHGIHQLIIPYWEFDNVPTIVTDYIQKLSKDHDIFKEDSSIENTLNYELIQKGNNTGFKTPVILSQAEFSF